VLGERRRISQARFLDHAQRRAPVRVEHVLETRALAPRKIPPVYRAYLFAGANAIELETPPNVDSSAPCEYASTITGKRAGAGRERPAVRKLPARAVSLGAGEIEQRAALGENAR
jgi:hypothetical protein